MNLPDKKFFVSGGGLVGNYTTAQFHLHWGPDNGQGSEHTLNGEQFAAEVRTEKIYRKIACVISE